MDHQGAFSFLAALSPSPQPLPGAIIQDLDSHPVRCAEGDLVEVRSAECSEINKLVGASVGNRIGPIIARAPHPFRLEVVTLRAPPTELSLGGEPACAERWFCELLRRGSPGALAPHCEREQGLSQPSCRRARFWVDRDVPWRLPAMRLPRPSPVAVSGRLGFLLASALDLFLSCCGVASHFYFILLFCYFFLL